MGKKHFIGLIFIGLLAFSCSKEEENGPGSEIPKSITDESFVLPEKPQHFERNTDEIRNNDFNRQDINDDGDDESGPNSNIGG
jgi:hypothetical protein